VQEEILEKRPELDVKVYAIFFEMVEGDRGAKSSVNPRDLLDDPRVTTFWDDGKIAGRWFDQNVTKLGAREGQEGRIEWDTFVLYDRRADWSGERPDTVSWGRTVYQERERLLSDLDQVSR
jgi:hypothetical protein